MAGSWKVYLEKREEMRPIMVGITRPQFERLVAIAISLGVVPKRASRKHGQQSYVNAMIRQIADGQLLVAYPVTEQPASEDLG